MDCIRLNMSKDSLRRYDSALELIEVSRQVKLINYIRILFISNQVQLSSQPLNMEFYGHSQAPNGRGILLIDISVGLTKFLAFLLFFCFPKQCMDAYLTRT